MELNIVFIRLNFFIGLAPPSKTGVAKSMQIQVIQVILRRA